jgi:hypothetical protein
MPIETEVLGAARRYAVRRMDAPATQAVKRAFEADSLSLGSKPGQKALQEAIADGEVFNGKPGKTYMETLLSETGGNGLPHVVSADEIAAAVGRGERELYRGVEKPAYAEQFKAGPLVAGAENANGSGIWVAWGPNAKKAASTYSKGPGTLLHMTLKPDAKVVDYQVITAQLKTERAAASKASAAERERLQALAKQAPTEEERKRFQQQAAELGRQAMTKNGFRFGDLGRYAALLGYDAVEMPSTGYMLVVNRTKLRVER